METLKSITLGDMTVSLRFWAEGVPALAGSPLKRLPPHYAVEIQGDCGQAARRDIGSSWARAQAAFEDACRAVIESAVLQACIKGQKWRA